MLRVLSDPVLHRPDPDELSDISDTTGGAPSPPPNEHGYYDVFDSNMVAERVSVYSSAASEAAEDEVIQLRETKAMLKRHGQGKRRKLKQ